MFIILISCDKVKPPYTVQNQNNPYDTVKLHIKKVLVEDYTGHLCPNCPAASEVLINLIDLYPGQIIPIAMHVGNFAMPLTPTYFGDDFRTPAGEDLNTFFGNDLAGLPNGFVNRREYSGSLILSSNQWGSAINEILAEPQNIDFEIKNTFDSTSYNLNTKINISFLQDFTQSLFLCVYLTEDSLVGWQKDNRVQEGEIENYVFRHVMRGSLNGTWGEKIQGTTSTNITLTKEYNNFQVDTSYSPVHCSVVVFAYDSATYEIFQSDEKPILEN